MNQQTQHSRERDFERDHEAHVLAVQKAVSNLIIKLGYPAEIVFEGAVKGGAAALIAKGASSREVAAMMEDFAEAFESVPDGNLRKH